MSRLRSFFRVQVLEMIPSPYLAPTSDILLGASCPPTAQAFWAKSENSVWANTPLLEGRGGRLLDLLLTQAHGRLRLQSTSGLSLTHHRLREGGG